MAVRVAGANAPKGASPASGSSAPAPVVPFRRASRQKSNLSFQLAPVTLGSTAAPFGPIQIPANGFMRSLVLDVTVTSSGNSAAVAFQADAPWNVIQSISLTTSSGDSLLVPVGGYALFAINKYGNLGLTAPEADPRCDPTYSAVTGTGAAGGSARFRLRIPMEVDPQSGYCSLPNLAANRSYYVQGAFNSLANVYSTAPTVAPSVSITATAEYWSVPNATNGTGDAQAQEPPGNGSFSIWQLETIPINAGTGIYQLHNVGNVIREIILVGRTAAGVRWSTAQAPNLFEWVLNNDLLLYRTQAELQRAMATVFGYGAGYGTVAAANETAQGQDNGVWVLSEFLSGLAADRPSDPRDQYLPTLDSTLLQLRGTSWGVSGTLEVYTNSIVTTSADALYAPHF